MIGYGNFEGVFDVGQGWQYYVYCEWIECYDGCDYDDEFWKIYWLVFCGYLGIGIDVGYLCLFCGLSFVICC